MGILYKGERITPTSKFSVEYGIAYEDNHPIQDSTKAEKILARYKKAKENNWIVVISGNSGRKFEQSDLIAIRHTLFAGISNPIHYIVKPDTWDSWKYSGTYDRHAAPFFVCSYRGESERYTKKEATKVMNIFINDGEINNVSIQRYNSAFSDEYVEHDNKTFSDPIETRFDLMDFDD